VGVVFARNSGRQDRRFRKTSPVIGRAAAFWVPAIGVLALLLMAAPCAHAQTAGGLPIPRVSIGVDTAKGPEDVAVTLQILFLLTVLSLAPAILIMMTSFTRIVIVLSFLRHALGSQQTPSNQIIIGLALFMTFFIMSPVFDQVREDAITPYLAGLIEPETREKEVDGKTVMEKVLPFQIAAERFFRSAASCGIKSERRTSPTLRSL
jgi:flagellar biosynthesis protein FliP